jgi:hypothetical protein
MAIPQNFNSNAMLKAASSRCGLYHFGEHYFKPALDKFIQSCIEDGYVTELGLVSIREAIVNILVKRLRFEEDLRKHPEILEGKIVSPLVILGSPGRVGSTKLHRVLANATNIQTTPLWQVMNPVPSSDAEKGKPDPRIKITDGFCRRLEQYQPQLYSAIQPIATEPDEDPYMFELSFMQFMFNSIAHVPSYMHWMYEQEWLETYRYHKKMLQYLQWQNGTSGIPMLLKGPSHTAHLDMFHSVFPDAKFVQIHRDPVTCIASMAKVVQLLQGLEPTNGTSSTRDSAELLAWWTRHCLLENLRIRERQPEIPIVDFYYEDVCDDAVVLAQKIFDFWGIQLSEESQKRMRDWELSNNQHKLGKFEYTLDEAGINREEYEATIESYLHRFYPNKIRSKEAKKYPQ